MVFPGSNCDHDAYHAAKDVLGQDAEFIWHKDTDLKGADVVILPGGFAYGDYLRSGAIARFSPIMREVRARSPSAGGLVLGICNGFQMLLEAGLLPGAMLRNRGAEVPLRARALRVEQTDTPFTSCCRARARCCGCRSRTARATTSRTPDVLARLEANRQVVFRYSDADGGVTDEANPNGSASAHRRHLQRGRNVVGLMPHPERACESRSAATDGPASSSSPSCAALRDRGACVACSAAAR